MISKELQEKLDYYEQVYFGLDEPIPFKGDLSLYPVIVKDYYKFYSSFGCLTMDKNVKTIIGEDGRPKKVSNPEGIKQSYMGYLISQMENQETGPLITNQIMTLFELIFHLKRGFYCPQCGKEVSYEQAIIDMNKSIEELKEKSQQTYQDSFDDGEEHILPKEVLDSIVQKARINFISEYIKCDCGGTMRDMFSIKNDKAKRLVIKDVELIPSDIDLLKALVPRQNILDYDSDKYIDPELKEELELKAKMQNKDYTSPTLEKQLVCVAVGTGFTLEYLKTLPMRKLSLLLKTVDAKEMYYAQMQGAMSGMVKFKEDPKHWIFSDSRKNLKDELTDLDTFERKFDRVT